MRPPASFVLGENRWRIHTDRRTWAEVLEECNGRGSDFAHTDLYGRRVALNPAYPHHWRRTLVHELAHVLIHHAAWDPKRIAEEELEESVAYAMEGWAELLARNPRLGNFLAS